MKHRYPAHAIHQTRTAEGKIVPKAPCGMACPKGWRLTEDGEGFEKEHREQATGD